MTEVTDARGRALRDLRISVTDRCNFRCVYCMPKEIFGRDYAFLPREQLLTFEEITRVASAAVELGVHKLRLTGGEPLLRRDLEELVRMLARLRTGEGVKPDIALTTNGSALAHKAGVLREAGLDRVTVSLDSLDDDVFRAMNDIDFPVARVLDGIRVAREAGLPVKVNTVVKRGVNDPDVVAIAEHFRGTGVTVRFIEFMDVGTTNGWNLTEVVPSAEVIERIGAIHPLEPVPPAYPGETATRWRYLDGGGEIGAISSVSAPFCGACTRARISADGKLFTCLFATQGTDLRALLRSSARGGSDAHAGAISVESGGAHRARAVAARGAGGGAGDGADASAAGADDGGSSGGARASVAGGVDRAAGGEDAVADGGAHDAAGRGGIDDAGLRDALARIWGVRDDRYSEIRASATASGTDASRRRGAERIEMSYIGG